MTKETMSVHEVAKLTGITTRTLHYYDEIGILKPTKLTEAGYRMYDDTALSRLQSILLFRELEFPLKEIKAILDSPDFDSSKAISQQIELLELKCKHIEKLITFAREIQNKGVTTINFEVFGKSDIEKYKAEIKAKWGNTKAYQEYKQKDIARNGGSYSKIANELLTMFSELGGLKHLTPNDDEVQNKIATLQKFITDNYYVCTNKILSGLGKMYVGDERFKNNIDKTGGVGTADFVKQAIAVRNRSNECNCQSCNVPCGRKGEAPMPCTEAFIPDSFLCHTEDASLIITYKTASDMLFLAMQKFLSQLALYFPDSQFRKSYTDVLLALVVIQVLLQ